MAICPNCHGTVSLAAESCVSCGALFGANAWKPIPDRSNTSASLTSSGASEAGAGSAIEHYVRLSSEDLKGLLRTGVLSDIDGQFVLEELQRRGIAAETVSVSAVLGDERLIKNYATWSPLIIPVVLGIKGALWLVLGWFLSRYAASKFLSATRAEALASEKHRFPMFLLYHSIGLLLYISVLRFFLG